uniref:Uncharacterized protein n=1 Tax=Arundo donax TaxID=35708 RepID=A0A0A9G1H4_ARUDO
MMDVKYESTAMSRLTYGPCFSLVSFLGGRLWKLSSWYDNL